MQVQCILPLSLCAHTYAQLYAHTYAHTHAPSHTRAWTRECTHAHRHSRTHIHTNPLHALKHARTHMHVRKSTHRAIKGLSALLKETSALPQVESGIQPATLLLCVSLTPSYQKEIGKDQHKGSHTHTHINTHTHPCQTPGLAKRVYKRGTGRVQNLFSLTHVLLWLNYATIAKCHVNAPMTFNLLSSC